jgi:hypothetical protein
MSLPIWDDPRPGVLPIWGSDEEEHERYGLSLEEFMRRGGQERFRSGWQEPGRPKIRNPDGSVSSEETITVQVRELNGGRPTNIPTIWSGRRVSGDEAVRLALSSGRAFPSWDTNEEAAGAAAERSRNLGRVGGSRTVLGRWANYNLRATLDSVVSTLVPDPSSASPIGPGALSPFARPEQAVRALSRLPGAAGRFFGALAAQPERLRREVREGHERAMREFLETADVALGAGSGAVKSAGILTMALAAEIMDPSDLIPGGGLASAVAPLSAKLGRATARAARVMPPSGVVSLDKVGVLAKEAAEESVRAAKAELVGRSVEIDMAQLAEEIPAIRRRAEQLVRAERQLPPGTRLDALAVGGAGELGAEALRLARHELAQRELFPQLSEHLLPGGERTDLLLREGPRGLAEASLGIGPEDVATGPTRSPGRLRFDSPVGREMRTLAVRGEDGEEVGHIRVRPEDGGYRVDWIEVDPAYRGQGVSGALYREADRLYGRRFGATSGQTAAGRGAAAAHARQSRPGAAGGVGAPGGGGGSAPPSVAPQIEPRLQGGATPPGRLPPAGRPGALRPSVMPQVSSVEVAQGVTWEPGRPIRAMYDPGSARVTLTQDLSAGEQLFQLSPGVRGAVTAEEVGETARMLAEDFNRYASSGRGRVSLAFMRDEEALRGLALANGMGVEQFLARRRGETYNVEMTAALSGAVHGALSRVEELAVAVGRVGGEGDTEANRVALAAARQRHAALLAVSRGNAAELARALRAHRELSASATMPLPQARAIFSRYRRELSDEQVSILTLARTPDELSSLMWQLDRPRLSDYAHEWWMSMILSKPTSHMRNVLGNAAMVSLVEPVAAAVRAPLSRLASRRLGGEVEHLRALVPATVAMVRGYRRGAAKALEAFSRGMVDGDMAKLLPERRGAWRRLAERYPVTVAGEPRDWSILVDAPLRSLLAEDAFFKAAAYDYEATRLVVNEAINRGLHGADRRAWIADNLGREDVVERALAHARRATFTDEMGEAAQLVGRGIRKIPGGRYVMPFVHIGNRLWVRGMELTPFGFVRAGKEARAARRSISAGKVPDSPGLAADLTARASVGSVILAAAVAMGLEGRIVGEAPRDPEERERSYDEGKQPWSFRIGDSYYPFSRMDPIAMPLAFGAILADAVRDRWAPDEEDPTFVQISLDVVRKLAGHMLDKSYMVGLSDFLTTIESQGPIDDDRKVQRFLARQIGGFSYMSGLQSSVATAIDPALRRPETFREYLYENVPTLRDEVPLRVNRWGEEVVPSGGAARGFLPTGTPVVPSGAEFDVVDSELARLGVPVGQAPRTVSLRRGAGSARLSSSRWEAYQRARGTELRRAMEELVGSEGYWRASDKVRRRRVEQAKRVALRRVRLALGIGGEEDEVGPR